MNMEPRNSRDKTDVTNEFGNRPTKTATHHHSSSSSSSFSYTNSIHKFVRKFLVCACGSEMSTVTIPDDLPPPSQDAEKLKQAFECWGNDERAIITVLGHRNVGQRKAIRDAYQQLCNKSLVDSISSELSDDFGKAVKLWTCDPAERDARLAHEALNGRRKGVKDFQVVVEIACANTANHLLAVRQIYCSLFDCSLEEEVVENVPLPMRKLLVGLVSSYRHNKQVVDREVATKEASILHGCILTKQLDNEGMELILATRNVFQLRATFELYKQDYGKTIEEDISSTGNGDAQAFLKTVIWCIASPEKHFAEVKLQKVGISQDLTSTSLELGVSSATTSLSLGTRVIRASITGLGTDEDSLTRAVVTRAEVDMSKIKELYLELNKETVESAITGDTSGSYKDFLLTLVGAKI